MKNRIGASFGEILVVIVFLALVFGVPYGCNAASCGSRWSGSGHDSRYEMIGGCQVQDGTKWIPEKNFRIGGQP